MKLELECILDVADQSVDSIVFLKNLDTYRASVTDIGQLEGRVVVRVGGQDLCGDYSDPIVRLLGQWLRKLPWILGGDTETLALRNSEHCFAFVPAGESIELSYFFGTETEIEEYVLEPKTLRLDTFVSASLALGERLIQIVQALNPQWLQSHEDCQDLLTSLNEAKRAWRDHQLHTRR